ncbi:MAG TPA: RDD family protein, partial [Candidatus Competibacteraceae bacterium]|nr:RDD family protein [Candidatus Competibacteraceae bacterium]
QVINDNGTPVDASASVIRNLLRVADFLPLLYGFGLVSLLISKDFKRLGDLAAGTVVIYQERPAKPVPLPIGPSRQPLFPLSLAERRVLIDFAERGATLNPARRAELAGVLTHFQNEHNTDAVETLLANARWLRGEQG